MQIFHNKVSTEESLALFKNMLADWPEKVVDEKSLKAHLYVLDNGFGKIKKTKKEKQLTIGEVIYKALATNPIFSGSASAQKSLSTFGGLIEDNPEILEIDAGSPFEYFNRVARHLNRRVRNLPSLIRFSANGTLELLVRHELMEKPIETPSPYLSVFHIFHENEGNLKDTIRDVIDELEMELMETPSPSLDPRMPFPQNRYEPVVGVNPTANTFRNQWHSTLADD